MATYRIPIVITAGNKAHDILEVGAYIDPRFLPVSVQANNFLVNVTDGLFVGADDIISAQSGNILIKGIDGKLYVPPIDVAANLQQLISDAPENQLEIIDGKLFVGLGAMDLNGIVSSMPDNILRVVDNRLYVRAAELNPVSRQAGNFIRRGADSMAYLDGNDVLSNQADNALGISAVDGKIYFKGVNITDLLSDEVGQLLRTDNEGKLLLTLEMLNSVKGIQDAPVDGKRYIRLNGTWVQLDGNIGIDANDKVISQSSQGLLTTILLTKDQNTGDIILVGRNGLELSRVPVVTGSFLKSAGVVTNPEGQPAGEYLYFTFTTTTTGEETIYVNVTHLVDEYTAANASIAINNNAITAVVDVNSGLSIGAFGITTAEGYQLMASADKIKLDGIEAGAQANVPYIAGNSAIAIAGNAISAKVDNTVGLRIVPSVGVSFEEGYSLLTEAQRLKLADIEPGAQANKAGVGTYLDDKGGINVTYGTTAGTAAQGNDPRLSDARVPKTHASTHCVNGSDPVTPECIGALRADDERLNMASAATGTADGPLPGIITLASDADTVSRNKAATPAGVAAQVAPVQQAVENLAEELEQAGKVDTVNHIAPDAQKNVQTTIAMTKAEFDAAQSAGTLVSEALYIITDVDSGLGYVVSQDLVANSIPLRKSNGYIQDVGGFLQTSMAKKIDLTLPPSGNGSVDIPYSGWLFLSAQSQPNQSGTIYLSMRGLIAYAKDATSTGGFLAIYLPVVGGPGMTASVNYSTNLTNITFYLCPAMYVDFEGV